MNSTSRITGILGLSAGIVLAAGCRATGSDAEWTPSGGGQGMSVFTGSASNVPSNDRDDRGAGGVGDDFGGADLGGGGTSGLGGFAGFGDLGSAGSSGGPAGTSPPLSDPCVIEVPPGEPLDDGVDGVTPCALQL